MQRDPQYRIEWRAGYAEKVEVLRDGEWQEDAALRHMFRHAKPEMQEWLRHCVSFGPDGSEERDFCLMTMEYDADGRRIHGNADDA